MHALIAVTLVAVLGSLWVRRDTWGSRWEVGLSSSIALQGCALLLMSPCGSGIIGPVLHGVVGRWNVEHLLGHICLIAAAAAIVHHCLTRLTDPATLRGIFGRDVVRPLRLGVPLMTVVFLLADDEHHADLFLPHADTFWEAAYWLLLGAIVVYVLGYARRILRALRTDPRSRPAANVYLAGAGLGIAACAIQVGTACAGVDISMPVWLCMCLGVMCFAYGSGRSWQARVDWLHGERPPAGHAVPPQPAA